MSKTVQFCCRLITLLTLIASLCSEVESVYRGGSYRGGSSYSGYRSYYSGYRSYYSGYRSYYSGYRSYYSGGSTYNARTYYTYYYGLYYYSYYPYSGYYAASTGRGGSGNVCKNYQPNQNGSSLGEFKCPLPFEPTDHTYCCGDVNEEYCCQFKDSSLIGVVIFAVIFVVVAVVIAVICGIKCQKKKTRTVHPPGEYPRAVHKPPPPYSREPQSPQWNQPPRQQLNRGGQPWNQGGQPWNQGPLPPPDYPPPTGHNYPGPDYRAPPHAYG